MNVSVLDSPRRRRRLIIAATLVVIAVPSIYLAAHYTTSGSTENANGPNVSDSFYREPKHVPFTAANRRAVSAVLAKFIDGAVSRHDLAGTWDLAGPGLRQGSTYDDWLKGEIPIIPFAASKRGQGTWSVVNYSYRNRVGLELLLFPEERSGQLATVESEVARGRDGRWRVDYWMITKLHGPGSAAAADSSSAMSEGPPNVHKLPGKKKKGARQRAASREAAGEAASDRSGEVTRLDAKWLFVPLGLISLAVLALVALGVGAWIRNRRAAAAYYGRAR
jgi:hypothetical protein